MNFEELINLTKSVKAPELIMEKSGKLADSSKRKSIIEKLKWADARTRLGIRIIQVLYAFFIFVFISILILLKNPVIQTGIGSIIIAFLLIILIQQLRFQKYNYLYADSSVIEFLNDAKKRMRVFTPRTWLVIPIWIFIDIGLSLIISEIFPLQQLIPLLIILLQVILLLAIVFDFYSAYLFWKKEHQPVISEIENMVKEIED